jgi:hypothetical protein
MRNMWLFNDKEIALCYTGFLLEETHMFVQVKQKFMGYIQLARYISTPPYTFVVCTGTTLTTRYRLFNLILIDCSKEIYHKFKF